ncbi:hypothetical protein KC325_g304 [Hortaea werneckii]|nr:hypothetical protein KC325_g304 [Hortaea werneckii]
MEKALTYTSVMQAKIPDRRLIGVVSRQLKSFATPPLAAVKPIAAKTAIIQYLLYVPEHTSTASSAIQVTLAMPSPTLPAFAVNRKHSRSPSKRVEAAYQMTAWVSATQQYLPGLELLEVVSRVSCRVVNRHCGARKQSRIMLQRLD